MSPRRIVMLGGSFNPPTQAHFRLMQAALDGLPADLGLYVPSCHEYVKRKMSFTDHPQEVLPDALRMDMLAAMCQGDPRMGICDVEMSITKPASYSYRTMKQVQAQYPEAEIYFIFGADKLGDLPRWRSFDSMTEDFRLLIVHRDGFDVEAAFAENERLAARREALAFLPQPEGTEDISSTAVRDLLRAGGDPSRHLHPGAAGLLTRFARENPMFGACEAPAGPEQPAAAPRRIVVLGGSFNPPTIAHFRLMQSALDGLNADLGFYVPSSHGYVRRKMKRTAHPEDVLPDELRLNMLAAMCADDPRMQVSDVEFSSDKGSGHSYETMQTLQAQYPEAELYFIFGGDKLSGLTRWRTFDAFTRDFRLLIFSRDGVDAEAVFAENQRLAERRSAFVFLPQPAGTEDVSSTAVRDLLRAGQDPAALLHPVALPLLTRFTKEYPMFTINKFRNEYDFLSNFFEAPVTWEGLTYLSAEAAFQAAKVLTDEERLPFTELRAGKAKSMGRRVPLRPDWEEVKTQVMEEVVRAKFTQNPDLAARLLTTGDAQLVEGNNWGDTCWGVDMRTGKGENRLGVILMKVRAELAAAQKEE